MTMNDTTRWGTTRRSLVAAAAAGALVLTSACGTEDEPEVDAAPPAAEEQDDNDSNAEDNGSEDDNAQDNDTGDNDSNAEDAADNGDSGNNADTVSDPAEDNDSDSDNSEGNNSEDNDSEDDGDSGEEDAPDEGAGDPATAGLEEVQQYVSLVEEGDYEGAYEQLSPEALEYYPDVETFEAEGVPNLADELADAEGEPQWAIRSAYEETHDSAQVVSLWGEGSDGEPFAFAFAVRKLDGQSWVIDQEVDESVAEDWANWLNPGTQQGVDPWVVNPDNPIMFALLKDRGPVTAVTASIDDGDEVSQELNVLPTDGAEMYELSDSELGDGVHVVTASWVGEDDPFVHTSATPATNP